MSRRKKENRQVFELMRNSDVILEVLDSRFPTLTRISSVETHARDLKIPLIIVLNKCDLVPREVSEKTKKKISREFPVLYISTKERQGTQKLRRGISRYTGKYEDNIVAIVGVPNTGKSSLLNVLRGKHVALTGQKPGVTRSLQIVRISSRLLTYDTPGVVPFDFPDEDIQAFLGAYPIEKLEDPLQTSNFFLNRIKEFYPNGLIEYYDLPSIKLENEAIISYIANKRGMKRKGGELNLEEASKLLMREFTSGNFDYWEEM